MERLDRYEFEKRAEKIVAGPFLVCILSCSAPSIQDTLLI